MSRQGRALFTLLSLVLVAGAAESKGHLQAGPISIELPPRSAAGRMTLANTGDAPVAAQIRVYAWSQEHGEDRLAPTTDVVVSPPIAELAANTQQVVRIVRQSVAPDMFIDGVRDRMYRIVVEELPAATSRDGKIVGVRMRYLIPLYLRASGAAAPAMNCRLEPSALVCLNNGGQAAQFGASRLFDVTGQQLSLSDGLFGYVLPVSTRRWSLRATDIAALRDELRLETRLNGQLTTIPVARAP